MSSSCSNALLGPDNQTKAALRHGALRLLGRPPGTFRLGCNWNTHSMCSEVACRAVDVVAPGALSSADVEWLVSARAQAYTLDQRVFGSWDGRDVFVTDIYVGVADAAGGFHPFRLSCTDGDVFNQLEV